MNLSWWNPLNSPFLILMFSFVLMWLSARIGDFIRERLRPLKEEDRQDFDIVLTATLTLLGLLIGFSFSMAITRYDQRKVYEEAEANAIGTEYLRVDLLPAEDAAGLRELLKQYAGLRMAFYTNHNVLQLNKINADTRALQNKLWLAIQPAAAKPTPVLALAVSGMNDVLNSQGCTQASWWNRIPTAAWWLMGMIAVCCNLLVGYDSHKTNPARFLILPVAISISFFLISDIDSPRGGVIRVIPHNLISLSESLAMK